MFETCERDFTASLQADAKMNKDVLMQHLNIQNKKYAAENSSLKKKLALANQMIKEQKEALLIAQTSSSEINVSMSYIFFLTKKICKG